jgi:hypothetical protein
MRMSSSSWVSSSTTKGLTVITVVIAIILLTANFTVINAQQQEQLTSQPGEIQDGTGATTTFQSTDDSFRIEVPEGWVIRDLNNTGSALLEETRQGYGILAQLCPEQQQPTLPNVGGNSLSCEPSENDVIHIVRYPDLDTRLLANNVTFDDNMTTDNILSYHLQKLQEVGYRSIQLVNSTDMTLNVTNPQTNQTIATVPAKLVEMTYSTNFAPDETRTGYFISTATNATPPNLGTTKGYSVFYEGNSTATSAAATAAEITTAAPSSLSPTTQPPTSVRQVFDSFELIAAPEAAQALEEEEEAQTTETAQVGDFNDGGDDNAVVEEDDDNGDDDGGNGDDDGGNGDDDGGNGDDDGGNGDEEGEGNTEGDDPNEFENCVVPPGRDPGDVGC